jgi:DNA-binding CsgD family transcriptional regulator
MQQLSADRRVGGGETLTALERRIIAYYAAGMHRVEIARHVGLAERTVGAYLTTVKEKLGARNLAHAAALSAGASTPDGGADICPRSENWTLREIA